MRRHRLAFAAAVFGLLLAACSAAAAPQPTNAPTSMPTHAPSLPPSSPSASPGGGEIGCDAGGHDDAYHIHSLVVVRQGGQVLAPPANIGITQTCMYWVHTHATDGVVHVEAPAAVRPTLGDFLDIWEVTFPDDALLAAAREAVAAGAVTVDDQSFDGDALGLAFVDRMRIVLGS
ncbi:MAG TPA: hypothetical protein VFO05_16530 [Candidatus Limnocylindrales bacterium]|nr:hypothetical protein [Candidatus Limnocylindrales bacterium]